MHTARYVTLSATTVDTPASPTQPALTHLIGVAMLVAERARDGRWSFHPHAATSDDGEAPLLEWVVDHLPHPATIIGWQIGDRLLPALLDAVAHAEAPLAHRFASACARSFTSPCIDLALDHGGAAAPLFSDVATEAGFPVTALDDERRFNAWVFSSLEGVRQQLEREALVLWQLWLARECRHFDAISATAEWLAARS